MLPLFFIFGFCFFGIGDCGNDEQSVVDQYVFQNIPIIIDVENNGKILNSTIYGFIWYNNYTEIIPRESKICIENCIEENRDQSWKIFDICYRYCSLKQPVYYEGVKENIVVIDPANEMVDFMIYNKNSSYYINPHEFVDKNENVIGGQYYTDLKNYVFTANMTKMKQLYDQNGINDIPNNMLFIPVYHTE